MVSISNEKKNAPREALFLLNPIFPRLKQFSCSPKKARTKEFFRTKNSPSPIARALFPQASGFRREGEVFLVISLEADRRCRGDVKWEIYSRYEKRTLTKFPKISPVASCETTFAPASAVRVAIWRSQATSHQNSAYARYRS